MPDAIGEILAKEIGFIFLNLVMENAFSSIT
jgi:hypothetical protein